MAPTFRNVAEALLSTKRVEMLAVLSEGPRPVGELAALTDVSPATAVFHIHKLVRAGLVVRKRVGRRTFVHAFPKTVQLVITRVEPEAVKRYYREE